MKGSRILHSHRQALTLLERARVRLDDTNVVYDTVDDTMCRTFNLPWRNLSVLLLGQGTSITNSAMRRLSEDDVLVAFTGSGGTPLVMASHNEGCHRNSRYLRPWVDIWTDPEKSLAAARSFQETRLASLEAVAEKIEPGFDFHEIEDLCGRYRKKMKTADNTAALMGFEGDFRESLYAQMASRWRIGSFKRIQRVRARDQDDDARVRFVSRAIDHGNDLACGVASLVLWILGIPGNMAVSHGHSRAGGLVCDLADSYKDAFVLPMAFALAAKADTAEPFDENLHRARVLSAFDGGSRNDSRVIGIAVQAMKDAIRSAGSDVSDDDAGDAPCSSGSAPGGDQ